MNKKMIGTCLYCKENYCMKCSENEDLQEFCCDECQQEYETELLNYEF
ncbi:MAG: hypothetical protein KOO69_03105 [Victivallales bacterium]|nr:hypothetical protein [Victivallales bacterium]